MKKIKNIFTKKRVLFVLFFTIVLFFCANISPSSFTQGGLRRASLNYVSAEDPKNLDDLKPHLTQPILDLEFTDDDVIEKTGKIEVYWLAKYIKALYEYGIYLVGVLALIMIMIGGLLWVAAGGSPERITLARNIIGGAISGLILGLCSYLLLLTINPALVEFRPIELTIIKGLSQASEICTLEKVKGERVWCGDSFTFNEEKNEAGDIIKEDSCMGTYCGGHGVKGAFYFDTICQLDLREGIYVNGICVGTEIPLTDSSGDKLNMTGTADKGRMCGDSRLVWDPHIIDLKLPDYDFYLGTICSNSNQNCILSGDSARFDRNFSGGRNYVESIKSFFWMAPEVTNMFCQ